MKTGRQKIKKAILVLSLLMITSTGFAQLPGFDDGVDDTTPAPISSLVALGLIAGAVYGIRKMK
jgi:hypothetical protein